LIRLKCTNRQS